MGVCRYAVQYEDGDKEEFELSELKKKKLLQPAGPQDKTDFQELERMYNAAKAEWAAGTVMPGLFACSKQQSQQKHSNKQQLLSKLGSVS